MNGTPKSNQLVKQIHAALLDAADSLGRDHPLIHFPGSAGPVEPPQTGTVFRNESMTHPFNELVFVTRGEADIILEDIAEICPKGSFMVIPSQTSHCAGSCSMWERPGVEDCSSDTLWMIAHPSGARLHFAFSRGEKSSVSPAAFVPDQHLVVLMELLVDETKSKERPDQQFIKRYLELIYRRLAWGVSQETVMVEHDMGPLPDQEITLLDASPLERAVKFIERNFDSKISIDDIAHAAYISRAQLTRLFRKERGQTVLEYVTLCRLDMAKSLLRHDSFSLQHTAKLSGFGSVSYMGRQFARYVGMPPSEYREISD